MYKDVCEARRETAAAALEATYRDWVNTAHKEVNSIDGNAGYVVLSI